MTYAPRTPLSQVAARGPRPGIAAVEMALVAPLLAMLIMGMIEITRIIQVKMALDDAARRGCRTAVVPGQGATVPAATGNVSNVCADVADVLAANSLNATAATLTVTVAGSSANTYAFAGTSPNYAGSKSGGTGTDPLTANSGTQITVKVAMPVSSFSWLPPYFVSQATVESETLTMVKQ